MHTNLHQRRDALLEELAALSDDEARFHELIRRAREASPLPNEERNPAFLVEGCLSQLWLIPEFRGRRCFFRCDADSAVVKGMAGLLCAFYSDAFPEDILALDPSFLRDAGVVAHLSANRRNVLSRVWTLIRNFAAAHATLTGEQQ